jgi:excisionase family DNA binding protein
VSAKAKLEPGYQWFNYDSAARYLGVSTRQLRRWSQQGKVGHTRMGLRVQFSKQQLDAFVESTSVDGAA